MTSDTIRGQMLHFNKVERQRDFTRAFRRLLPEEQEQALDWAKRNAE